MYDHPVSRQNIRRRNKDFLFLSFQPHFLDILAEAQQINETRAQEEAMQMQEDEAQEKGAPEQEENE